MRACLVSFIVIVLAACAEPATKGTSRAAPSVKPGKGADPSQPLSPGCHDLGQKQLDELVSAAHLTIRNNLAAGGNIEMLRTPYLGEGYGIVHALLHGPSGPVHLHYACRHGKIGAALDYNLDSFVKHVTGAKPRLDSVSTRRALVLDVLRIVHGADPMETPKSLWRSFRALEPAQRKRVDKRLAPHKQTMRPFTVEGAAPWRARAAGLADDELSLYEVTVSSDGTVEVKKDLLVDELPVPRRE